MVCDLFSPEILNFVQTTLPVGKMINCGHLGIWFRRTLFEQAGEVNPMEKLIQRIFPEEIFHRGRDFKSGTEAAKRPTDERLQAVTRGRCMEPRWGH